VSRAEVLDLLTLLVDKSLVLIDEQDGEARYRLLEPIRQYGRERLEASGEVRDAQARHAACYVALAERAEPELHGPRQLTWLRRLDRELDNARAALGWAEACGDTETVLRLAGALWWYWWMRGHLREGQRWLEPALARDAAVPAAVRAKALCAAALLLGM